MRAPGRGQFWLLSRRNPPFSEKPGSPRRARSWAGVQQPCPVLHLSACHPLCSLVVTEERAEQPDGLQQAVDWASSAARPKVMISCSKI